MSSILRAARANLTLALSGLVLAAISSLLIARWLGPETFADYATLMALLTWLLILAEAGCNSGIGRFWREAAAVNARASLYHALQFRRWGLALSLSALLVWLGPIWAESVHLPDERWRPLSFFMIGLLAAVILHGQLASSALLTEFRHGRALLTNQSMMIARALLLALLAGVLREPVALVGGLLVIATVEAWILHRGIVSRIRSEQKPLPPGMATAAQKHGLVALFDKLTTALSGGPFLLLILAGVHSRRDLAMLAIATDLLQKALSVIGLPLSNLVMPLLNESRGLPDRFRLQIARLGGLTSILLAVSAGGIMTVIPLGLPMLLGATYESAVPIMMIWLLPLFFESGVRMIWGASLIVLDQYAWLVRFNLVYGAATLLVVLVVREAELLEVLTWLGLLRFLLCLVVLRQAARLGLLPPESRPVRVVLLAGIACILALVVQALLPLPPIFSLLAGVAVYAVVLFVALRWLSLVPGPSYDALCLLAGKHKSLLLRAIPPPKGVI